MASEGKQANKRTNKQASMQAGSQANRSANKQVSKQAGRQALREHSVGAIPCRGMFNSEGQGKQGGGPCDFRA